MPGHTVQEMLDILGLRLEDEGVTKYSVAAKLDALNKAQLKITNLVHPRLLTELEVKEFGVSCALASGDDEGSYAFTSLDGLQGYPLADGIQMVRLNGGGAWCHEIELKDIKKTDNSFYTASDARPYFWIDRERIYVAASTDTTLIDIWYLREPKDMVAQFTVASVANGAVVSAPDLDSYYIELTFTTPGWTADEFNGMIGYNETKKSYFLIVDSTTTELLVLTYPEEEIYAGNDVIHFVTSAANQDSLSNAACELNPSLHGLIVDLAESHLWTHDGQGQRSKEAYQRAVGEIQFMNAKYGLDRNIGFADRQAAQ